METKEIKNVHKSLDHNALFYHKGFMDFFITVLGKIITNTDEGAKAKFEALQPFF